MYKIISILGFQGGANYEKITPNHSFINVANFESPKHLASYLLYLDKNPVSRNICFNLLKLWSKGLNFSGKISRIFCLEENSFNYSKISHLCIVRNVTSRLHQAKIILKSSQMVVWSEWGKLLYHWRWNALFHRLNLKAFLIHIMFLTICKIKELSM